MLHNATFSPPLCSDHVQFCAPNIRWCAQFVHVQISLSIHQFVCICLCAFISLCVWVCVVSVVTGQTRQQQTHPYKTGGEPSFLLINLAPPPVLIGSVQHLNDVSGLKRQLPVCHGHVVPYRLSVYDRTSTYQLEKLKWKGKKSYDFCFALLKWNNCNRKPHGDIMVITTEPFFASIGVNLCC